jgi:Cyclin, N-terminal domain
VLQFHEIEASSRAKLVDWILSVLRAFGVSSHPTFFVAISMMDRYFIGKYHQGITLGQETLYLIGLTAIFLSSKFEDSNPIKSFPLRDKAGHRRFSHKELTETEQDFLTTLEFRLHQSQSIFNDAATLFTAVQEDCSEDVKQIARTMKDGGEYLVFLCYL